RQPGRRPNASGRSLRMAGPSTDSSRRADGTGKDAAGPGCPGGHRTPQRQETGAWSDPEGLGRRPGRPPTPEHAPARPVVCRRLESARDFEKVLLSGNPPSGGHPVRPPRMPATFALGNLTRGGPPRHVERMRGKASGKTAESDFVI